MPFPLSERTPIMKRRTKILATLGPATDTPEAIEALIMAGVNAVRLNFSHGEAADHRARAERVRTAAKKLGSFVAIMGDLQGPKIRIARFKDGKIDLAEGDQFELDAALGTNDGSQKSVGIEYKELVSDSRPGDVLLLDDGRIELEVEQCSDTRIMCRVLVGGNLSNNKGINRKGGGLSASALTEKDKRDIVTAANIGVDFLAVSFPRDAADMHEARRLLVEAGGTAGLIAKIERAETVATEALIDEIVLASEGVMVARGDLGVEIGDAELIGVQKQIIKRARDHNRFVITATQMMESMIESPIPTRAEVFDVANAVLDGTDVVMLSAETAVGHFPVKCIEAMVRVIVGAEKTLVSSRSRHRIDEAFSNVDETIALSAMYAANHLEGIKALICMTETGATPLIMSRIRSGRTIYAYCRIPDTQNRVCMYRGVQTIPFDAEDYDPKEVNDHAIQKLREQGIVEDGDQVIITMGDFVNSQGGTNTMKIAKVGPAV